RVDVRASADVGLTESLAARVSAVSKMQDGYIERRDFGCDFPAGASPVNPAGGVPRILPTTADDCVMAKEGEVNFQAVRGQLRWQPTSRLDVNIIADYTHDDRTVGGSVLLLLENASGNVASTNYSFTPNPAARELYITTFY